jgi:hypothetical protein
MIGSFAEIDWAGVCSIAHNAASAGASFCEMNRHRRPPGAVRFTLSRFKK